MTDTGDKLHRLRKNWDRLESDDKFLFAIYFASIAVMAGAVILQFGWVGTLFIFGALIWKLSGDALS